MLFRSDIINIILTRGKKITFVAFSDIDNDQFLAYRQDVMEDIGSLSDSYGYRNPIEYQNQSNDENQ